MRSSIKALVGILCIVALTFICSAAAQASTFSAMGTVTDANGNPIQNATITLVNNNYGQVALTKSDASGNFEFVSVDPGTVTCKVLTSYTDSTGKTYTVPPEYSNWFNANGSVWINQTYTQITDFALPQFSAMGTVTDKNGNPVEGARIMMIDGNKKETAATRSDANGHFEFASMVPTTMNFTVSVLFINGTQSYKNVQSKTYPQSGTIFIDSADTKLNNYTASAMSQQATVTMMPVSTAVSEKPVNMNALVIALLLGILILAGTYLLLRKGL